MEFFCFYLLSVIVESRNLLYVCIVNSLVNTLVVAHLCYTSHKLYTCRCKIIKLCLFRFTPGNKPHFTEQSSNLIFMNILDTHHILSLHRCQTFRWSVKSINTGFLKFSFWGQINVNTLNYIHLYTTEIIPVNDTKAGSFSVPKAFDTIDFYVALIVLTPDMFVKFTHNSTYRCTIQSRYRTLEHTDNITSNAIYTFKLGRSEDYPCRTYLFDMQCQKSYSENLTDSGWYFIMCLALRG